VENETTDGDILSGSPQIVRLGGTEYTIRTPPRRWAREMRGKWASLQDDVKRAGDDAAVVMGLMESLLDRCLTHPSLAEHRESIEESATDEECGVLLGIVAEQLTSPLVEMATGLGQKIAIKAPAETETATANT